jgi:sulfur carrier protein ThiS adenylyltransferase
MNEKMITVLANEQSRSILEGSTVGQLRQEIKPDADVLVVNGFPSTPDTPLKERDEVIFIRRGEIPKAEELEALMVSRHTPGVHARLKKATVGIAGLGGLGSAVTIALARVGIGTLILVDFDLVEPSNLNRQHYGVGHIGLAKVEAMGRILEDINPYLNVVTHQVILDRDNIPRLFQKADIVVECFDRPEAKVMIMRTVAEALPKVYMIGASGMAGYGDSNSIQTMKIGERIFMVGDFVTAAEPGRGLMAPRVGIAAHHQANLVVSLLMDPEHAEL